VLPEAQDAPAAGAESAGDKTVAGLVAGDLFSPELGVLLGLGGVERAAMPEAAVHEDGEFMSAKHKVRPHLKLHLVRLKLERSSTPPAGDAERAKDGDEPQLGGGVAAALYLAHPG